MSEISHIPQYFAVKVFSLTCSKFFAQNERIFCFVVEQNIQSNGKQKQSSQTKIS